MKNEWTIGIDIGGTKIIVIGLNSNNETIETFRLDTQSIHTVEELIKELAGAVKMITKTAASPPKGIGIGIAGQILSNGLIHFSHNLPNWKETPLKAQLEQQLKLPVFITNDVRAAALGEWKHGAGKGCSDLVCVLIGTGIGGGIISGGRLLTGFSNTAGELGHMTVDLNGPKCSCGNIGCLEAIASGWAIAQQAKELNIAHADTARDVINLYQAGNAQAKEIISKAKKALIAGAVSIVNAFNPQRLILGGGVVHGLPEIIEWVDAGVRERALEAATIDLWVLKGQLSDNAVAIGAASLAL